MCLRAAKRHVSTCPPTHTQEPSRRPGADDRNVEPGQGGRSEQKAMVVEEGNRDLLGGLRGPSKRAPGIAPTTAPGRPLCGGILRLPLRIWRCSLGWDVAIVASGFGRGVGHGDFPVSRSAEREILVGQSVSGVEGRPELRVQG